jgi:hypothetical protein
MPIDTNPSVSAEEADAKKKSNKHEYSMTHIDDDVEQNIMEATADATRKAGVVLSEPMLFRAEAKRFYLTKITDAILIKNNSRLIVTGEMSYDKSGSEPFPAKITLYIHKMYRMGTINILN